MSEFVLDFRLHDVGGPVMSGQLSPAGMDELQRAAHIVFLFHGYNVNRDKGTKSLHNLATRLRQVSGDPIVSVLWPGDHWSRAISYPFEGRDADDTAASFSRFVTQVMKPLASARLSFVTHSLGARVAMGAAGRLAKIGYKIGQICLMAAAIDDTSLARPKYFREATESAERIAVLSSANDKVLRWAYPAGDLLQAFIFWRDDAGRALGLSGPRSYRKHTVPANVLSAPIPENRNVDHGDYLSEFPADQPPVSLNRLSAAAFADAVVVGQDKPLYP